MIRRTPLYHWFANQPLRIKGLVAIAVPLVVLVGALVTGFLMGNQTEHAQNEVQRILQVQHDIQELHTRLAEAATGVRGYLLTGQESFLDHYEKSERDQPGTLERLRLLIRDPEQANSLTRLAVLAREKSAGLRQLLRLGPDTPHDVLRPVLLANKAVLDQLRDNIDAMLVREEFLRVESMRYADAVNERVKMVMAIAVVAGVIGTLLTMSLFSTGIVRRVEALAANARLLERGEPLVPVEPARDELGQLANRMAHASELLAARAAEVQRARDEAERANQAKTEFLSRTSHELRTPLNAILGYAQLLERDLHAPDAPNSVALISKGGQHLLELINDVLDIARIETGRLDLAIQAVTLADVLDEALTLHTAAAGAKRMTLAVKSPAPQVTLLGDRRRLLQVLLNLLSNAVKYTQMGGVVNISVTEATGRARISVADNGPGIGAAELARLFVPFERLDAARHAVEGSGLGLAVCKQLVEAMHGEIGVQSAPGSGSTFWIELPLAPAAIASAPDRRVAPALPARGAVRVLYLHEGPSNAVLIEALLGRRGNVQMHAAALDDLAAAGVRGFTPDLVLIDVLEAHRLPPDLAARFGKAPLVLLHPPGVSPDVDAAERLVKPLEVPPFLSMMERLIP